jgi:hypothetical protein
MVENLVREVKRGQYGEDSSWVLVDAAEAMAPLDLDRSLEIARSIPKKDDPGRRVHALQRIARIVLETAQERERRDYLHGGRASMWIYGGPMPR